MMLHLHLRARALQTKNQAPTAPLPEGREIARA
jgi:hypothetical protein